MISSFLNSIAYFQNEFLLRVFTKYFTSWNSKIQILDKTGQDGTHL